MRKRCFVIGLLLTVFLSLASIEDAKAIPTFARKYRTSCTTCHIGFNRLNPFGSAYRMNGYQIPQGQEAVYVKEEPVSLGAPAWKRVWPDGVWPGMIPQSIPLSMMVHQRLIWNESARTRDVPEVDFDFPHEWELLIGGDLGDMISFFGEFVLYEDDRVEGVQRLFVQFNDLLTGPFDLLPEDALNLKLGKFDIAADPFHNPTRRTLNKYLSSDYLVGDASFKLRNLQKGFEANGIINSRWRYALGLVDSAGSLNSSSEKDRYWRLAYKFGGMTFDGKNEDLEEELKQTNNWVDNSLTVGTFGYVGKEDISGATNDFTRLGGDIHLQWENLDLSAAWVFGDDDDPGGTGIGVNSRGWFTQAEYVFYPWLIGSFRYESLDYTDATNDVTKLVPSIAIYARANVRIILEGAIYPDGEDGSNSLLVDLAIVF